VAGVQLINNNFHFLFLIIRQIQPAAFFYRKPQKRHCGKDQEHEKIQMPGYILHLNFQIIWKGMMG